VVIDAINEARNLPMLVYASLFFLQGDILLLAIPAII
jgi:hypothetical protein